MARWLLKAAVQGTISRLPEGQRLNSLLQRYATRSTVLSEAVFANKVSQCSRHIRGYRDALGSDIPPRCALELGTGWYPIVPLGLVLSGVEHVYTVDINPLLDLARARQTLEAYAARLRAGELEQLLPEIRTERAEEVIRAAGDCSARTPAELLEPLGIHILIADARATSLASGSVQLFVSNNTLEHVPVDDLARIMAEFRRLSAPEAVMDHFIDMSDHYAHFDSSITPFNYMRYTQRGWRLFNNSLQYQNRLRVSDYRRIIEAAGFRVVASEVEAGRTEELDGLTLAPPFAGYERSDLLGMRAWMTAVPAA